VRSDTDNFHLLHHIPTSYRERPGKEEENWKLKEKEQLEGWW